MRLCLSVKGRQNVKAFLKAFDPAVQTSFGNPGTILNILAIAFHMVAAASFRNVRKFWQINLQIHSTQLLVLTKGQFIAKWTMLWCVHHIFLCSQQ